MHRDRWIAIIDLEKKKSSIIDAENSENCQGFPRRISRENLLSETSVIGKNKSACLWFCRYVVFPLVIRKIQRIQKRLRKNLYRVGFKPSDEKITVISLEVELFLATLHYERRRLSFISCYTLANSESSSVLNSLERETKGEKARMKERI